jgi:hypothetical protein
MMRRQVIIRGDTQRAYAKRLIDEAPIGDFVTISKPTRSLLQNARLHAMIADIQRQVPEMVGFSAEDIKLRFMNALGTEMRFLPALEGQGMFPVGMRSSTLTVQQFSGLVELLYAFGAKHGVVWSEPERAAS